MSMTHREAQLEMQRARNRDKGRKLQNNTRLYVRGEGPATEFAIVLHGTEVVTIKPDGSYVLRAGGYHTITTSDRIRTYSPAKLFSIKGDFYLWMKPTERDPRPDRVERSIPKPYEASDPGAEPIKSTEGCLASNIVTTVHKDEIVEVYRRNMLTHDVIQEVVSHGHDEEGMWDRVKVKRTWSDHVYYGESRHYDEGWAALPDNNNRHGSYFTNGDGEKMQYIQCPHCAEFDSIHETWHLAMHGPYWHRRFDAQTNYVTYVNMMERFGSQEAWQEAYIEDFRDRRAYNQADREWEARNRVPFYDGITIDSEGYAHRLRQSGPSPAKLRRHEAEVARTKKRIAKYADSYIKALRKGMPMPSGGDCWFCALHDSRGRTWGDMGNNSHLFTHMSERYYVPTLAVNALRERGLTDAGVYLLLDMDPVRPSHGEEPAHMVGTGKMGGNKNAKYDDVRRYITKYMQRRLIPAAPTQ